MTGPLAGQTYTQVMLPMGAQTDQWIADVASYIRNEFGNTAAFIARLIGCVRSTASNCTRPKSRAPSRQARHIRRNDEVAGQAARFSRMVSSDNGSTSRSRRCSPNA